MVNRNELAKAANGSIPFTLAPNPASVSPKEDINAALEFFLEKTGQKDLAGILSYCAMELYANAQKANLKRWFFETEQLDISSPEAYERGIKRFRKEIVDNRGFDPALAAKAGYKADLVFQLSAESLQVAVRNTAALTPQEKRRIEDRIGRSLAFETLEEAIAALDEEEGAGLGIIIVVLTLKKLGIGKKAFSISEEGGTTTARLTIPVSAERTESVKAVSSLVVAFIEKLPDLPENIRRIRSMIADRSVDLSRVAELIAEDPAMSAETLKLANSALFVNGNRIVGIVDAVLRIGTRGVSDVLLAVGVQRALGVKTEFIRDLWSRSHRNASRARTIAKTILKNPSILDDAYAGGLLGEIGTIVLSAVHPKLERNLRAFCVRQGISPLVLEELLAGFNSAETGALAAEKWNFPRGLAETIRFRHAPSRASAAYREIVETVYLAECMTRFEEAPSSFQHFDPKTLAKFGAADRTAFAAACDAVNRLLR